MLHSERNRDVFTSSSTLGLHNDVTFHLMPSWPMPTLDAPKPASLRTRATRTAADPQRDVVEIDAVDVVDLVDAVDAVDVDVVDVDDANAVDAAGHSGA